jgi:hypothetical protein
MWWPAVVKSEWEFPLTLDYGRSPHAYVNQRLQIQLELLMMSGMQLETCCAFNERWNNKFYYKVASCWLFLLSHTTMHGSMNIKPELSLCVFVGVLFTFNKYSEFLVSLVICIHAPVGPWRTDFESFFWLCLQQIIFYVTLLVKYRCHFVVSLV